MRERRAALTQVKRDFEKRQFTFEHIFKPDKSKNNKEVVFGKTSVDILENVLLGFNGCVMAYGQTGTGKTYTIVHELIPSSLDWLFCEKPESKADQPPRSTSAASRFTTKSSRTCSRPRTRSGCARRRASSWCSTCRTRRWFRPKWGPS